jgi:PhoPQ-activated pathogenicity-related protein
LLISFLLALSPTLARATALDDYVAAADGSYGYSLAGTINDSSYTAYVIDMTSQTWRSPSEVSPQVWQHYVTIIVPTTLAHSRALLLIDGGDNGGSPPTSVDSNLALAATQSGSVVVRLRTVPNQPLQFAGEGFTRSEDSIIAKTFRLYLDGGDDEWPLLLPMTKSAVRAMDTAQTFLSGLGVTVNDFVVSGGSKRGWTTWLTAAVDGRVSAIAPAVFDALNLDEQITHHEAAYLGVTELIVGGYSFALADYVNEGIPDDMGTPEADALLAIVDPYEYRDRLAALPKYLVNACGDEFFVPDSAQFYFHDLPGQNYLRYVPNVGHGLNDQAILEMVFFYWALLAGASLPDFSWTLEADGSIRVETVDSPSQVKLWRASNPDSRDFRGVTFGAGWSSTPLADWGGGVYIGKPGYPETGATAFMIELTYSLGGFPVPFTTEIRVLRPKSFDAVPLLPRWGMGILAAGLMIAGTVFISFTPGTRFS